MTAQLLNFVFWGGRYIKKEILTQGSFLDFRIRILRLLITNRTRACTNCTTHADQNKNLTKTCQKKNLKKSKNLKMCLIDFLKIIGGI